jgi:hypothetical protein
LFCSWNGFQVEDKILIDNEFLAVQRANGGGDGAAIDRWWEKFEKRSPLRLGVGEHDKV